jgi:hypothetical protein
MPKPRVDRQFAPADAASVAITVPSKGTLVVFRDAHGELVQRYDLSRLGLPAELAELLAAAFRGVDAGRSNGTRDARWNALKSFARFVNEDGSIVAAGDLTTAAMWRYVRWLEGQKTPDGELWAQGTRVVQFTMIGALLGWAIRNRTALPEDLTLPFNPFGRTRCEPRKRLPQVQLKAILRVCYEQIDTAWTRFMAGQAIVASPELPPKVPTGEGFKRWLWRIHRLHGGLMPTGEAMKRSGLCPGTLKRYGYLKGAGQHLHLTTETLVPFYLAIAIQTAGNPDAIRMLRRDCLIPHPLEEHRVIVTWAKPRARGRAQRRAFDTRRPHAAPNLIEKVRAMAAPLLPYAREADRDLLFLNNPGMPKLKRRRKGHIGVIDSSTLAHAIRRFARRADQGIAAFNSANPHRKREPLGEFAPAFFRGSVAAEHYKASEGDILVAQRLLNHGAVSTTEAYIKGDETNRMKAQAIARLQKLMLAWIGAGGETTSASFERRGHGQQTATAPFGHDCLAPLIDGERLCPRFSGCLACPGLVVPLDAEHLAHVLQAKRHMEEARDRIDPHRWAAIYAPAYRVLADEILPDFPLGMHAAAERRIPELPELADLE